jgi:hypothetical protein
MINKFLRRILPKSASYTIRWPFDSSGQEFTNRGATGTITFTLPTPKRDLLGVYYRFRGVADYAFTVASAAAGDIVTKNDASANSVSASTGGELIGALIEAICEESVEGTFKWAVSGLAVGHTYTVAT